MAKTGSINGISVRNLVKFKGHEEETCYQGDVYYKGKLLGFWSQDAWSGPDRYSFDTKILDKAVEDYRYSKRVSRDYRAITDLDILLWDLMILMEMREDFKRDRKLHNSITAPKRILVETQEPEGNCYRFEEIPEHYTKDYFVAKYNDPANQVEVIGVYNTLEDFEITAKPE